MEDILLERMQEKMKQSWCKEEIKIGVVAEENEVLYVMEIRRQLITAVLVKKGEKTWFLAMADSTGYKRGYNWEFITAVIHSLPGFVVCFSYPKDELIFRRGSCGELKKIQRPFELFRRWKSSFACRCACCKEAKSDDFESFNDACYYTTWSNFDSQRGFPYKHLNEIENFDDDPKTKMREKFNKVDDLFAGLLHRKDFTNGGFLFSNCICQCFKYSSSENGKIDKILNFLRSADFTGEETAINTTSAFWELFIIKTVKLTPTGVGFCILPREEDVTVRIASVRRVM